MASIDIKRPIDIKRLVPIGQAPKLLLVPVHVSTFHRWRTRGVRGIRLETILIGGRRYLDPVALEDFARRLTSIVDDGTSPPMTPSVRRRTVDVDDVDDGTSPPMTPSVRRRAVDAAEREVDARMPPAKPNAARG